MLGSYREYFYDALVKAFIQQVPTATIGQPLIDYSIAGKYANIVHALAFIESIEVETRVGDSGHALGVLQQHTDFFVQWYKPAEGDTWTEAYIKACCHFLDYSIPRFGINGAIQAYNLGLTAYRRGDRNVAYLQRWTLEFQQLGGQKADYVIQPTWLQHVYYALEDKFMWQTLIQNWRTTIVGLVLIIGSLCYLASKTIAGGLTIADIQALIGIISGTGFMLAKDSKGATNNDHS